MNPGTDLFPSKGGTWVDQSHDECVGNPKGFLWQPAWLDCTFTNKNKNHKLITELKLKNEQNTTLIVCITIPCIVMTCFLCNKMAWVVCIPIVWITTFITIAWIALENLIAEPHLFELQKHLFQVSRKAQFADMPQLSVVTNKFKWKMYSTKNF